MTMFGDAGSFFLDSYGSDGYGTLWIEGDRLVLTIETNGDSWTRVTDLTLLPVSE